jgi:oligoribonuclease NrnB/cAMP/cGMP phosphodiesterase (DHH superfamily)
MSNEALKLALEALKDNQHLVADNERHAYVMEYNSIIEKLEEALAKQEQGEPVAWIEHHKGGDNLNWEEVNHPYAKATPLYTTPQQRKPLDLTSAIEYADARWAGVDVPVEWLRHFVDGLGAQQRTWVGLTDDDLEKLKLLTFEKEINAYGEEQEAVNLDQLIRATEQLCKENNHG